MKHLMIFISLFFFAGHSFCQLPIPTPEKVQNTQGTFHLKDKCPVVYVADKSAAYLELLQKKVLYATSIQLSNKKEKAAICFVHDSSLSPESYKIHITQKQIEIRAKDKGGFIYAVQTLRQWVSMEQGYPTFVCADITDSPRLNWRCFMLDSGRQFQKVPTIKKYIDMASLLKMNRFHWHLTEGLGWRIEIKRYPKLTQTGAFVGKGTEQQGFYSQDDIREIVKEYYYCSRDRHARTRRSRTLHLPPIGVFQYTDRSSGKRIHSKHILCR